MIKLTLDTNCVINILDYQSKSATSVEELAEIFRYALDGDVNIAITTRVESDINNDKDEARKIEIKRRLASFPVIGTVARLDISKFDSGDVWGGEENERLEKELKNIIFPGLKEDDIHFGNKINDIDHLIGHKINKRDIFVTDDTQILKKSETLKMSQQIEVMDPKKALEYLNLQGNRLVLVQEFYDTFLKYKEIIMNAISKNNSEGEDFSEYEEIRKWLIRKYSIISDGLLSFKFQMSSVPISGQRIFGQDDIMNIQHLNEKLNGILKQRDPLSIPDSISYSPYGNNFNSESQKIRITLNFLNNIEDLLLGYLGKLENNKI